MGTTLPPDDVEMLPAETRRLHRALLEGLLAEGRVPPLASLARASGINVVEAPGRLRELADGDYFCLDGRGAVSCLYPLSPAPTSHVVHIDGQRHYAMCALDAHGVLAMLDLVLDVEGVCAVCGAPVRLRVTPDAIERAEPATTLIAAYRGGDHAAAEVCCPFIHFACGPEHGQALSDRRPRTNLIPLDAAQTGAAEVFGEFQRAVELPAKRRRVRVAV